mgnify:CR=1 FL=1
MPGAQMNGSVTPPAGEEATAPVAISNIRHRITFATRKTLAYVSVLELGRIWERCLRRAGVPVKYSQGYNPRPRMQFAAPLPVGCGSEADLLDIVLEAPQTPESIAAALAGKTPPDLDVLRVTAVPHDEAALSEQLFAADYQVWLRDVDANTVISAITDFLQADTVIMAKRGRKYRGKTYNLRPLVEDLRIAPAPAPWVGLQMRVTARPGATGRPDEVLKALGLAEIPRRCTRLQLHLTGDPFS